MKHTAILILSLSTIVSCAHHRQHDEHHHEHETIQEHHHVGDIILHESEAKQAGIKTYVASPKDFQAAILCSGKIISGPSQSFPILAPCSGIINWATEEPSIGVKLNNGQLLAKISAKTLDNNIAHISYEAARKEYQRAQNLYTQNLISEKEYLSALRDYELASTSYEGQNVYTSHSGFYTEIIAKESTFVEQYSPIAVIQTGNSLRLQAFLPIHKAALRNSIKEARFKVDYSDEPYSSDRLISAAQSLNTVQGSAYLPITFEIKEELLAGSYAEVWLLTHTIKDAIVLPASALIEEQGEFFVYIKQDEDSYNKQAIKISERNDKEVLVLQGIEQGQEVVYEGAYQVKLASIQSVPGHSHNH